MKEIDYKLLGSAVQNGKIKYLSVSSVTKFDPDSMGGCPRRWYYHYIERDKEEGTAAQALGTQVHAEIAHYLTTGQDLLGNVARPVLPFLPSPVPDPMVEAEFQIATQYGSELKSHLNAAGIPFVGEIDILDFRQVAEKGYLYLTDHKTTSRKPTDLPGQEIADTVQMTGYGIAGLEMFPQTRLVGLQHNYIGTKKRYCAPVMNNKTPAELRTRWDGPITAMVERMKSVASEQDVQKIEQNVDSCNAWQRSCKYMSRCFPDPLDALVRINKPKENDMGLNLLQKLTATPAAPVTAPSAKPPLPPPAGQRTAGPAFYTSQQQDLFNVDEAGNPRGAKKLIIEEVGVLPPDAPKSDPAQAAEPPPMDEPLPPAVEAKIAGLAEPKKRGRPPNKKNVEAAILAVSAPTNGLVAATTTPVAPQGVGAMPQATAVASEPASATNAGVSSIVTLNTTLVIAVDCIAPGVQSLHPYINALVEKLTSTAGVLDVRTVQEKPLGFGGWKGVLAALAKAEPPPPGLYSVVTTEFTAVIVEGLEVKGATVLRGGR